MEKSSRNIASKLGTTFKEIQGLLEEKHQKHKAYLSDTISVSNKVAYSNICKAVQTRLRDMQDSWLSSKADEIQSFADRKDMKKFFGALKTVYGPQSSGTTPLLSADGTNLLTDNEAILKRWTEHFDSVLNRPHLSMMMLSTEYHRWSVICCLTSSQPSLKQ